MGANLGITAFKLDSGFLFKRKTLNIKVEEISGQFRYLICRDASILRTGTTFYANADDAYYHGYVRERQEIDGGTLYE